MVSLNSRLDDVQWIGDDGGDGGGDGGGEESRAKGDDVGGRRGRVRVERWVGAAEDADGRGHEESFGTGRVWGRDAERGRWVGSRCIVGVFVRIFNEC